MSNNAPSTAGSNDTVIGWIDYYNSDKKFGFAYAGSDRVFFHLSACREVEGTPEVPVLTDRRNSEAPTWYRGSRHAEQIVLRVVPGTKGPMALVWGHLPKRTWLEKMLHWKTLTAFDHGEVNILYSTHQRGRSHREVIGRMTQAPTLEPGDPWRLTIKFDYYQNHYSGRSGEKVLTFELRPYEAFPSKSRPEDCGYGHLHPVVRGQRGVGAHRLLSQLVLARLTGRPQPDSPYTGGPLFGGVHP